MKSRTALILLAIHFVAFALMMAGQLAPSPGMNLVVVLGFVFEFPGCWLGAHICKTTAGILTVAAVFNSFMYWSAGKAIDAGTRQPPTV